MIDLDVIPPNWQFAAKHGQACRPGKVDNALSNNMNNTICPCCLKIVNKEECSLFQNSKELQFLGFGIPLYFIFVKYCIILLFILIMSYNGLALFWGISNNYEFCSHRLLSSGSSASCTSFLILFSRIQHAVTNSQRILRIFSFVLHLFALIYIRNQIRKTLQYYDERTTSLSDYALLIKHLPLKTGIQQSITNFIHNHFKLQWDQLKVKYKSEEFLKQKKLMKIILLPNLDQFYLLQSQKKQLIEDKKQQQRKKEFNEQQMKRINNLIINQQKKIKQHCDYNNDLAKADNLKCEQAILILNSQIIKSTINQYGQKNTLNSELLGKYFGNFEGQIQILEAPEPKQIVWKNIDYSPKKRLGRIIIGWLLTFGFIAVVTVIFYFMLSAKTDYLIKALQEQKHPSQQHAAKTDMDGALALVYIIIILIIFFNKFVMGWVLHYFAHIQKHYSTSDQEFQFAFKYTLGLFFTTALMTLAVQAVSFHNFYAHAYGVIQQEGIMFFMNAFFIQLIWLVNPWQLFVLIKRKFKYGSKDMTQRQANELMQDNEYTVGKRYAQVIQTLWFTFLYATLIPQGAFLTIIGISLYYWIDKYNLLRRSSLKSNLSGEMTLFSLKLLDVTLFLRVIGEVIFDSQVRDGVNSQSIVLCGISVVYLIIPIDSILDFFHEQKFRPQQKTYEQVQYNFIETYHTLHPILNRNSQRTLKRIQRLSCSILEIGNQLLNNKKDNEKQIKQSKSYGFINLNESLYNLKSPNDEINQSPSVTQLAQSVKIQLRPIKVVQKQHKQHQQKLKKELNSNTTSK